MKRGFTLTELMIVIGTIGILSGIVITAVNPRTNLSRANQARIKDSARQLSVAINKLYIDSGNPAGQQIKNALAGLAEPIPLCAPGVASEIRVFLPGEAGLDTTGCLNIPLEVLEILGDVNSIPLSEANTDQTIFEISHEPDGQLIVEVPPEYFPDDDDGGGDDDDEAVATGPYLYWFDNSTIPPTISREALDGSGSPETIVASAAAVTNDNFTMVTDLARDELVWNAQRFYRVDLNGGTPTDFANPFGGPIVAANHGVELIVRGDAFGASRVSYTGAYIPIYFALDDGRSYPAVDLATNKIYFWGAGPPNLVRADLNGQNQVTLDVNAFPQGIALDASNYLYYMNPWTDQLKKLNTAAAVPTPVILASDTGPGNLGPIRPIQFDEQNRFLYWLGSSIDSPATLTLHRASMDGGPAQTIRTFTSAQIHARSFQLFLDPFERRLLWTQYNQGAPDTLMQADLSSAEDGVLSDEEISVLKTNVYKFLIVP